MKKIPKSLEEPIAWRANLCLSETARLMQCDCSDVALACTLIRPFTCIPSHPVVEAYVSGLQGARRRHILNFQIYQLITSGLFWLIAPIFTGSFPNLASFECRPPPPNTASASGARSHQRSTTTPYYDAGVSSNPSPVPRHAHSCAVLESG